MKKKWILFFLVSLFSLLTFFILQGYYKHREIKNKQAIFEKRKANWAILERRIIDEINKFDGEVGIVIKDLGTDLEISFNKEKLFPSASLVKIPIMAVCFLLANNGKLNLNQSLRLKTTDKVSGSGILKLVIDNTDFTIDRLIGFMIYESDNTASNILTNLIGLPTLNTYFKNLGLKNTFLSRNIADYRLRNKGIENYTTAADLAFLLEKIYRGVFINKNISDECIKFLKLQRINDRLPKYLPAYVLVAHKTGLERNVCHDVGIVFTKKGDFIICVLTKHKSPVSSAKEFIAKVSLLTYSYFEKI